MVEREIEIAEVLQDADHDHDVELLAGSRDRAEGHRADSRSNTAAPPRPRTRATGRVRSRWRTLDRGGSPADVRSHSRRRGCARPATGGTAR